MTEQTFEVGDKVSHEVFGDGEVKFGPYTSYIDARQRYAIEMVSGPRVGRVAVVNPDEITLRPDFEHCAFVLFNEERNKVVAGPFNDKYAPARPWYVLEDADGNHETSSALYLKPAPADEPLKVGDWVRVVVDDSEERTGEFVGLVGEVVSTDPDDRTQWLVRFGDGTGLHGDTVNGQWWCEKVERVTDEPSGPRSHRPQPPQPSRDAVGGGGGPAVASAGEKAQDQ